MSIRRGFLSTNAVAQAPLFTIQLQLGIIQAGEWQLKSKTEARNEYVDKSNRKWSDSRLCKRFKTRRCNCFGDLQKIIAKSLRNQSQKKNDLASHTQRPRNVCWYMVTSPWYCGNRTAWSKRIRHRSSVKVGWPTRNTNKPFEIHTGMISKRGKLTNKKNYWLEWCHVVRFESFQTILIQSKCVGISRAKWSTPT